MLPLFVPPAAYAPQLEFGFFWFGAPEFWTQLPVNRPLGRREKVFWWSQGYDGSVEHRPNLAVSIKPFGGGVASFVDVGPTNAFFGRAWSMLTMLEFPSAGCWEVTGSYRGRSLTFVTAVQ